MDADKFLSSRSVWNRNDRTVILFGDVWFSEDAIRNIMKHDEESWTIFCRFGKSELTGCPYGEIYGFSFELNSRDFAEEHMKKVGTLNKQGKLWRSSGWEIYRSMSGAKDLTVHKKYSNYVLIDDWTEDFDFPRDYEKWMRNRAL